MPNSTPRTWIVSPAKASNSATLTVLTHVLALSGIDADRSMPSQHGVHTWLDDSVMDRWPQNWNAIEQFQVLPRILADGGYRTALIGKYHLGSANKPQNGFHHWVALTIGH